MNRFAATLLRLSRRAVLGTLALAFAASAAPVKTEHVVAEIVAARTALVPGQEAQVALRLDIEKGWHTYWRNPGDTGLPTTLAWKLPPGYTASDIEWPAPRVLTAGPLVNYGYESEVLHLVRIQVPRDATVGTTATLAARADWLVCKETCIPDGADLTLAMPVAASARPDGKWAGPIAAVQNALPRPLNGWSVAARGEGTAIDLALTPTSTADPGVLRFFPFRENQIEPSAPQPMEREASGAYVLTLPVSSQLAGALPKLEGVVTASNGLDALGRVRAASLEVPVTGNVEAPAHVAQAAPMLNIPPETMQSASATTFGIALLFALAGGLILNLMPCVFPVLSLKVLGFVSHHDSKRTLRHEAIAFGAGVIATFLLLGVALVGFRAAGEQLGWGFQLQSPAVVTALAVLFFVLALNLSGVFEFGMLAPSGAAGFTAKNRTLDAFASGVLAVVIASPCTAPFMGGALGFALTQSAAVTLLVFGALGVGMMIPYVLLAWFPGWRRVLPRPGLWMERLKQFLAFPLYGTVAWLAWVLGAQLDNDAVLRLALVLVLVALGAWAWRAFRGGNARFFGAVAALGAACAIVVALPLVHPGPPEAQASARSSASDAVWGSFTPARVAELGAAGQPVFVDFTAAWCVTCQVNKKLVLNRDDVRTAFADHHVALLRADWTRRDPEITRALAALGRNGVPVYVLYRPGKDPLLLPEVLQAHVIRDALASLDVPRTASLGKP